MTTRERLRKMWTHYVTQWQRTWKRLEHSIPFLLQFSLGNFGLKCSKYLSPSVESTCIKHYHTAENIVRKHLSQLNTHKSIGPDETSLRVLMKLVNATIYHAWKDQREVAVAWKKLNITCVPKKSKREDPGSY